MQHFAHYNDLVHARKGANAEEPTVVSDELQFSIGDAGVVFCQVNPGRLTAGFSMTLDEIEQLFTFARGRVCRQATSTAPSA